MDNMNVQRCGDPCSCASISGGFSYRSEGNRHARLVLDMSQKFLEPFEVGIILLWQPVPLGINVNRSGIGVIMRWGEPPFVSVEFSTCGRRWASDASGDGAPAGGLALRFLADPRSHPPELSVVEVSFDCSCDHVKEDVGGVPSFPYSGPGFPKIYLGSTGDLDIAYVTSRVCDLFSINLRADLVGNLGARCVEKGLILISCVQGNVKVRGHY